MVNSGKWVHIPEEHAWEYQVIASKYVSTWDILYDYSSKILYVSTEEYPNIDTINPFEYFDNFPNVTIEESTLFELQYGIKGEPLLELQQLLEQ